jgi:hypothetical protein
MRAPASETGFLPIFIVTQPKISRNPVSDPSVPNSETGFLAIFIVTQPKISRNLVSDRI